MKKGRKGKKGKKTAKTSAKASKSKPSQTVGNSPIKRLSIMKQHLKKKGSETDATVPAVVSKTSKGKAKPSSKAKARKETKVDESQGETLPPSKKVYQERVKVGKTWRYQILPEQQFGCANCRFIYGGCRTCQNPKFRGKTAKAMREIEALQRSASAGSSASQVAAATAEPRRKRKAPTRKQKKGAKKPKGLTKSVSKDVDWRSTSLLPMSVQVSQLQFFLQQHTCIISAGSLTTFSSFVSIAPLSAQLLRSKALLVVMNGFPTFAAWAETSAIPVCTWQGIPCHSLGGFQQLMGLHAWLPHQNDSKLKCCFKLICWKSMFCMYAALPADD